MSDNAPRTAEMTQEITTGGRVSASAAPDSRDEVVTVGLMYSAGAGQPPICNWPTGPGARTDEVGAVSPSRQTRLSEGGLSGAGCSWRDCSGCCSGPSPAPWAIRSFQACMQVHQEVCWAPTRPLPRPHSKADVVPSPLASASGWLPPRHTPRAAAILAPRGRVGPSKRVCRPVDQRRIPQQQAESSRKPPHGCKQGAAA